MTAATETTTDTTTISSRSRNLGYGWDTSFRNEWRTSTTGEMISRPVFDPPTAPTTTGGLAAVEAEMARRYRICSGGGTYFSHALFVGGRRVRSVRPISDPGGDIMAGNPAKFYLAPPGDIVRALRHGAVLEVHFADKTE